MSKEKPIRKTIKTNSSADVKGFDSLAELALNMRSSWNHATDEVWKKLDPVLWERTHNPWGVLNTIPKDRLEGVLADPVFRKKVEDLIQTRESVITASAWFQQNHPKSPLTCVAYFCMEFMLSESLPIYSGGLGNVAGDQLKAASDLGVPVIGVGLLYAQGYFRQTIDKDGAQQVQYPHNDPEKLPITPYYQKNGEQLRLEISLPGYSIWLRVWQVMVGRVKLYLLDSNDGANNQANRGITSELYGGGPELRLKQELLLGIGGWRLLEALGLKPEVCHLNEGHAAFAVLERARSFMKESGQPFDVALAVTRVGNLFTTHTAVKAGFDLFLPALIEQYFGRYAKEELGISFQDLMALGRKDPKDSSENFNMAYLAFRGSGAVNGVSRLHGKVSQHLFAPLFPGWPIQEVPIGHVTNGVHVPSWDSAAADDLWTNACGKDRWLGTTETLEQSIRRVPDDKFWLMRTTARRGLVEYVRERLPKQLTDCGDNTEAIDRAKNIFNPNALTLGFARRFASYKRPNLLLQDPQRLLRLLSNKERPVQLIMAGKAHPADKEGQALIKEWIHFIRTAGAREHVIFLSNYDLLLAERLVQGVDVWINTPRRPWEASGTSGMKILVNGGLNLSELDGWWAEAYTPKVGWALGDGQEHSDDPAWDAAEAKTLYECLENEIIPEFYNRNNTNLSPNEAIGNIDKGIPIAWVQRIRESMSCLTPQFSANRSVREYTKEYYIPAAESFLQRAVNKGAIGTQVTNWHKTLGEKWGSLHFGEVKIENIGTQHVFNAQVYFKDLDPNTVQVELFADATKDKGIFRQEMKRISQLAGLEGGYVYSTEVPANRLATDYTARLVPHWKDVEVPLEEEQILWQK